jgi:hypothetical protein
MKRCLPLLLALLSAAQAAPVALFDGQTFEGWEGETAQTWRIENGEIVGGSLTAKVPNNEFLATKQSYADFELRLEFKLSTTPQANAGVQIRSERIAEPAHEMIGYQADLGEKYYGALYDESRRRKILAAPAPEVIEKALKRGEWNEYRIRCAGPRVQLWINGTLTVDYTETDEKIVPRGRIALQIHGGPPAEVRYRNITIEELP